MSSICFSASTISCTSARSWTRISIFPSYMPSSALMVTRWILTSSFSVMTSDISWSMPLRSIPLIWMVASKKSTLCMSHFASRIRLPKLDLSLLATGHALW